MNNYNPTEMLAEEMMARLTAANREIQQLRADLAAATARAEAAEAKLTLVERYGADQWRREELDAMRADPDLCLRYLDAVLDGMTVQELAALADKVRARWGLGEVRE